MICPNCGYSITKKKYPFHGLYIMSCDSCNFQWLDPQPTDDQLNQIYNDTYFLGKKESLIIDKMYKMKRSTASLYLKQLIQFSGWEEKKINGLKLLEIGCGTGDFLLEAESMGFEISGLDVNSYLVEQINLRLNANRVLVGNIEEVKFPDGYFDAVVLFDVVEHVRDAKKFLSKIHGLLKQNGKIFIVTPSLDSWSARILGRHWMEYKLEHLTYYGKKSIKVLLNSTGYCNPVFFPNYKYLNFDYINSHFERFPVKGLSPMIKIARFLTPNLIAYKPVKIVASGMGLIADKCLK